MTLTRYTSLWLVPGLWVLSGCLSDRSHGLVDFSPDGKVVAFVRSDSLILPVGPEPVKVLQTAYVSWAFVNEPAKVLSVKVADYGPEKSGYTLSAGIHFRFSPNSKLLSVVTPARLLVIDLATSASRVLSKPGEHVTGMAWIGDKEVGYVTHTCRRGEYGEIADRIFWRQKVFGNVPRKKIYAERGSKHIPLALEWPFEHWSPEGSYVLFTAESRRRRVRLLRVSTGTIREFPNLQANQFSWRQDASAAFCLGPEVAAVIEPRTGKVLDLTDKFRQTFKGGYAPPSIEPLWTPDGNYVVGYSVDLGGFLIQALKSWPPQLYPQRTDGWVRVWLYTRERGHEEFAVDYEGRRFVPLGDGGSTGWSLSPDGKRAACVKHGRVVLKEINLPPKSR